MEALLEAGAIGVLAVAMLGQIKIMTDFQKADREESRQSRKEAREAYDRHIDGLTNAITKNTEVMHELAVYLRAQNGHRAAT